MPVNPQDCPRFASLPLARVDRWRALERMCHDWGVPWRAADGEMRKALDRAERRLGLSLPTAMREWYEINGSGFSRWKTTDQWLTPDQFEVDAHHEMLVFRVDEVDTADRNAISAIRIDELGEDDPAVVHVDVVLDQADPDGDAFSIHAIQQCIFEAKLQGEVLTINDMGSLTLPALYALGASLKTQWERADLGDCFHAIWNRTAIYEAPDLFAIVARTDRPKYQEQGALYVCGRTGTALNQLPACLREELRLHSSDPRYAGRTLAVSENERTSATLAEVAGALAEWTAELLRQGGFAADFSLGGLVEIDRFIDEYGREGRLAFDTPLSKLPVPAVAALGAYLGETIIRNIAGRWWAEQKAGDDAIQVRLESGGIIWPVQRVRNRLVNGSEDGLEAYGRALTD